jgi:hypothetical protein
MTGPTNRRFNSFADFYPFYLTEHSNLPCLAMLLASNRWQYLLYALLCGYAFAWVGHFL